MKRPYHTIHTNEKIYFHLYLLVARLADGLPGFWGSQGCQICGQKRLFCLRVRASDIVGLRPDWRANEQENDLRQEAAYGEFLSA